VIESAPTALSLFSGAGGLDLGITQAGFNILASVEVDPNCCSTLRAWVERAAATTKVIEKDIRAIDPGVLMQDIGLRPGQLDLLAGGPPCQAFSQIGKRASLEDPRGLLLFEMLRFAKEIKPRAILIEQVKGLLTAPDKTGKRGGVLEMFLSGLAELGYEARWRVLNSADFGVPQVRQRVFVIATSSSNRFVFPSPEKAKPAPASLFPSAPYITVGQALAGLTRPERRARPGKEIPLNSHIDVTPDGDRRRIRYVPEGGHLAAQHHLSTELRRNLSKKDTTKFRRLARKEPSLTLRCGEIFFHPTQSRYLTPREYMRLHGYPDEFELRGPIRSRSGRVRELDQHRQVANSVPPPLARALALAISTALGLSEEKKSNPAIRDMSVSRINC
jgi:DNA (cytosine-5)-methyltransferase 1